MSKDTDFKAEAKRLIAEAEAIASHRTADNLEDARAHAKLELPENRRGFWQKVHAYHVQRYRNCKAHHSNLSLLEENRASLTDMFAGLIKRQTKDAEERFKYLINLASYCEAARRTAEAIAAELDNLLPMGNHTNNRIPSPPPAFTQF